MQLNVNLYSWGSNYLLIRCQLSAKAYLLRLNNKDKSIAVYTCQELCPP